MAAEATAPPDDVQITIEDNPAIDPASLAALRGDVPPPAPPAAPASPPPPPPAVSVRFGDRQLEVDLDVARQIEAERLERERLRGELEALRRQATPASPPAAPVRPERPPPQRPSMRLALDDVEAYERQVLEYEAWRELELERRLEARYREDLEVRDRAAQEAAARAAQRRDLESFLGRVVAEQPALAGEDDLVLGAMRAVAAAHPADQLPLAAPATVKLVAQEAAERLVRLAEKGRALAPRPPRLEGQARTPTPPAQAAPPEGPFSIADIQRARRAKRAGGRG